LQAALHERKAGVRAIDLAITEQELEAVGELSMRGPNAKNPVAESKIARSVDGFSTESLR
jgi:hypothetical protein